MTEIQLPLSIAHDHPSLAGHFPGQPIVPGVVLLDEVILAIERQWPQRIKQSTCQTMEILVCKFLSPVSPGALLTLSLEPETDETSYAFRLHQSEKLVATGTIRHTLTDERASN